MALDYMYSTKHNLLIAKKMTEDANKKFEIQDLDKN